MSRWWRQRRELFQKGHAENYLFDRYVFRYLSLPISVVAAGLGIQPNTVTLVSLLSALGSLYFLTMDEAPALMVGAALIAIYYTLDHVDGELARYYVASGKRKQSTEGEYFDVLCHWYSSNLMLFFLGIGAWRSLGYEWAVLLGFLACIGTSHFPMLVAARVAVQRIGRVPEAGVPADMTRVVELLERKQLEAAAVKASWRSAAKWRKLAAEAVSFPGILMLIILAVMMDALLAGPVIRQWETNYRLLLVTAVSALATVQTLLSALKWFREYKTVGSA